MGNRVAYGLTCDVRFDWPWAPASTDGRPAQLRIELGTLGPYADYAAGDYRLHALRAGEEPGAAEVMRVERGSDGHYRMAYADGAVFAIDASASQIYGSCGSSLTLDDLIVYLQGPVLGFLQRLRGVTCLHAGGVVIDGRAVALVGEGGMGKSTSVACLARLGLPVLCDDVLALELSDGRAYVQPGLPRVMLWPPSVEALWGAEDALPLVVAGWDKRFLDLNQRGYRFAQEPAPLGAIYLLGERLAPGAAPEFAALSGTEALMSLAANSYANDFLDTAQRAQEFELLGQLVNRVPVRRLRAPEDRAALARICDAILEDFRALPGAPISF